jgi:hypothetical protein
MGLLDEVKEEQLGRRRGGECSVGKMMRRMDRKDAAELTAALEDEDITAASIAAVLQRRGFDVKYQAIQRHRRDKSRANACACPR